MKSEISIAQKRIEREKKTVAAMIKLYCRRNHVKKKELCSGCQELLGYAFHRLRLCPFTGNKPTCARCPVHCYSEFNREKIRRVMRFSGPRMIFKHPILALFHMLDGFRSSKNKNPK